MKNLQIKKRIWVFLVFILSLLAAGCSGEKQGEPGKAAEQAGQAAEVAEGGAEAGESSKAGELPETENPSGQDAALLPEAEDGCGQDAAPLPEAEDPSGQDAALLPEDGTYSSKEEVSLYLHQYGHLPSNFITKKEAEALGWQGGSLEPYAPGMCIGGSRFGNYEGLLPEKDGRTYTECDIDTLGADKRGAKRIVFSNDGLIYYTKDHYESFELLYGEE